jgi:hypothetical protein
MLGILRLHLRCRLPRDACKHGYGIGIGIRIAERVVAHFDTKPSLRDNPIYEMRPISYAPIVWNIYSPCLICCYFLFNNLSSSYITRRVKMQYMIYLLNYFFAFLQAGESTVFHDFSHHKRCKAFDPCWPSQATWAAFNTSIAGKLVASHPSAALCHDPFYNETACAEATENWANSDWRMAQVGAYSAILWEVGDEKCFVNDSRTEKCGQGLGKIDRLLAKGGLNVAYKCPTVPRYSVDARSVEDIQKAVKFADKHNLYLVVKNTGHDQ